VFIDRNYCHIQMFHSFVKLVRYNQAQELVLDLTHLVLHRNHLLHRNLLVLHRDHLEFQFHRVYYDFSNFFNFCVEAV